MSKRPRGSRPTGIAYNPGDARWCETHLRLECTKNRSKGRGPCHKPPVYATNACNNHSGVTLKVARVQGESRVTAWTAIGDNSKAIGTSDAVLGVLQMSWLRLAAYSELLRQQVVGELSEGQAPDDVELFDADGTPIEIIAAPKSTAGIIGHRYGMGGKEGILYRSNEEVRALITLEAQERDRVVKYAKAAHDMGISDKMIRLAEKWGDVVAVRIAAILDGLDLTPQQQALSGPLIQRHLSSIDMSAEEQDAGQ